jgi:hypothetical protein
VHRIAARIPGRSIGRAVDRRVASVVGARHVRDSEQDGASRGRCGQHRADDDEHAGGAAHQNLADSSTATERGPPEGAITKPVDGVLYLAGAVTKSRAPVATRTPPPMNDHVEIVASVVRFAWWVSAPS